MATIPMSDVLDHQLLPIDAQDIVTKVRLVIAGNRAGAEPLEERTSVVGEGTFDLIPEPVVYEYEAPEHATFGAVRSLALPDNIDPFLPPTDPTIPEPEAVNVTNAGDPSAVRDGDPATYAEGTGTGQMILRYMLGDTSIAHLCAGFRLRYGLTGTYSTPIGRQVLMQHWHYTPPPDGQQRILAHRRYQMQVTAEIDEPTEMYAVSTWDARGAVENRSEDLVKAAVIWAEANPASAGGSWRVYAFYPLFLNEPLLANIAKANIRLPAQLPQRVTVRGYVAPDREHTIQGWPGGDYTGVVAQHQYELGRTVIDFEQAGPPVGLPAEAVEAERVRLSKTAAVVDRAVYGLKMGERQ